MYKSLVLLLTLASLASACGQIKSITGKKSTGSSSGGGSGGGGGTTTTSGSCTGSDTLIDSNTINNSSQIVGEYAVYFLSTITGNLTKVGLHLWQGTTNTTFLFIRTQTANDPVADTIISNGGIGQVIALPASNGGIAEYTLTTPVPVTINVSYWIHVRSAAGNFNVAYRNANVKAFSDLFLDFIGLTGWDAPFSAKGCQ